VNPAMKVMNQTVKLRWEQDGNLFERIGNDNHAL
jgi:hypothetical protein